MDFGTISVGIIGLLACAVPIILSIISRKQKQKQLLNTLRSYASQHNCEIEQYEVCGNYIIGIDKNNSAVFFESKIDDQINLQHAMLNNTKDCNLVKRSRNISGYGNVIDSLVLNFSPLKSTDKAVELEFYNGEISSQLAGELQSIESWHATIKQQLKK